MLRVAFWSPLTAAAVVCFVSCVAQGAALQPVAEAPGGFQAAGGPAPLVAKGKPMDAAGVAALAGKPDGYDVLVDGLSLFGMDYAHKVGRREPLRPLAADLSDWSKARACPPDQVLIDPQSGRMRFFPGHDPAAFQSRVVARFRGTHGDAAFARWRGDIFFLSHWESSYHVWAYDARNPAAPAKIAELPVDNFAHGFVLLDSGWALMGTTGKGIWLLDLRDPRQMKVVKRLLPGCDWVDSITPRYVAVWRMPEGVPDDPRGPRVFDVSKLPDNWAEVTAGLKPEVRRYLSERVDLAALDGPTCFRAGDQSLAFIDLKGEPAAWRIIQTVRLPALPGPPDRWTKIRVQPQVTGKRFVLLYPVAGGGSRLQVLDASQGKAEFLPALEVEPTASHLSLFHGRYAYVSVLPKDRGAGQVGTWPGVRLDIYDLADPAQIKQAGTWDPGFPTRDMQLMPHPAKEHVALIMEDCTGMGFHFADLSEPLRPKLLSSVPTNGEGNRVAAWGDRAMYTSSTLAQWFDLADPLAPKRLATWFNHRWFYVRHVYDDRAVVDTEGQTEILDFRHPGGVPACGSRPLWANFRADAAWGSRLYYVYGGPRSGRGPIHLAIADMADPARLAVLSDTELKELDTPAVVGLCADGPLLYGITEGGKQDTVFLLWDVSDPKKPSLLAQLRHPQLRVQRGEWFWTAQGHVLAAANGIVLVTSYGAGPPAVIDARNPHNPKFLMLLPYQGRYGNEMTDCRADGPWFYVKSYPDPAELWDFSRPEKPQRIWEEPASGDDYGAYAWQAGVPLGPVLLIPQMPGLKIVTVPRPSQVPVGKLTVRAE